MRVAVVGGGILGLTAARELAQADHKVTVFEKEEMVGGLAGSFEIGKTRLEKYYHHIFTSDNNFIDLVQELGLEEDLWWGSPKTAVWDGCALYPFSSPLDILRFPPLSPIDRVRLGSISAFLKVFFQSRGLENQVAGEWCRRWMGNQATAVIWEPLLKSKFHGDWDKVTMAWLWARIKKRSFKLGYLKGGFGRVSNQLVEGIRGCGGEIRLGEEVTGITGNRGGWKVTTFQGTEKFDRVLVTAAPPVFSKLVPDLPSEYSDNLRQIKFVGAESLIFVLKKKLTDWYWINICDEKAPFLALVEHTNFADPEDYGGKTVVYLGNYLDSAKSRFKKAQEKVVTEGIEFLKNFNKQFDSSWVEETFIFRDEFAQPVVTVGYKDSIPAMRTPLEGLFYANFCQIYPWDRGMDQSVALGKSVVDQVRATS